MNAISIGTSFLFLIKQTSDLIIYFFQCHFIPPFFHPRAFASRIISLFAHSTSFSQPSTRAITRVRVWWSSLNSLETYILFGSYLMSYTLLILIHLQPFGLAPCFPAPASLHLSITLYILIFKNSLRNVKS